MCSVDLRFFTVFSIYWFFLVFFSFLFRTCTAVGQQHVKVQSENLGKDIRVDKDVELVREHFHLNHIDYEHMSPIIIPDGYTRVRKQMNEERIFYFYLFIAQPNFNSHVGLC